MLAGSSTQPMVCLGLGQGVRDRKAERGVRERVKRSYKGWRGDLRVFLFILAAILDMRGEEMREIASLNGGI